MSAIRHRAPVAVLSYYEPQTLPTLLKATRAAHLPKGTPVYVGNYGINGGDAAKIHALPGGRYAPIFTVGPSNLYRSRQLDQQESKKVGRDRYSGAIPPESAWASLSIADRVGWGKELGRRMRDEIRHARAGGTKIDSWQLDEVLGEASTSRPVRDFLTGVMEGVHYGRKQLGDRPLRGITYVANSALPLAGRSLDPALRNFWKAMNGASIRVGGEEYPNFAGDPAATARAEAQGQLQLYRDGGVRRQIAEKYIPTLSPGERLGKGLGGNVLGMSRGQVNHWRDTYMETRAAEGTAGFAEYNFRPNNNDPRIVSDTMKELARALRRERK